MNKPFLKPVGCSGLAAWIWTYESLYGHAPPPIAFAALSGEELRHWVHVAAKANLLLDRMVEAMRGG